MSIRKAISILSALAILLTFSAFSAFADYCVEHFYRLRNGPFHNGTCKIVYIFRLQAKVLCLHILYRFL